MPRFFLTRLKLEGFRGINNEGAPLDIRLKPDSVNSVFAVNGIGKSSIFEAIHYAIFDSVPKLDALQAQEKPQDYFCNRFHSQNAATIDLEFTPDDGATAIELRVQRDEHGNRTTTSPSGHPDPDGFLVSMREAFALLDYRTFSRFIEESPLERGRTFSTLLGLSAYSDCRQSLQAVSDTRTLNTDLELKVLQAELKASQTALIQALATIRASYEKVIGKAVEDTEKLADYSAEIAAALAGVDLLSEKLADQTLPEFDFDEIKALIKTAEGGEKRRELEKVVEGIAKIEALSVHDLESIKTEQAQLLTLITERDELLTETRGDLFKKLYSSAEVVIGKGLWTDDHQCPLCESEIEMSISGHVKEQLAQYTEVATKASEIKALWQSSGWKACLAAFEEAPALKVEAGQRKLAALNPKFSSGDISKDNFVEAVQWTSDITGRAPKQLADLVECKVKLEEELPDSLVQLIEQVEYARQFKDALAQYRDKDAVGVKLKSRIDIREKWRSFIAEASGLFSAAETALSKARISSIDSEYKSMFKDIMQVGDVVPDLQRVDQKQDLLVELSDFHGQKSVSARALLSESYRNALAISVFLAAAQSHAGMPRFIVLDDVTSSFDAGHQFFLMELLRRKLQYPANPSGLQFIVLSHDGLLEKYFDRLGGSDGWHHNRLQGSPPMGSVLNQTQGVDRLKTTITTFLSVGQISEAEPLIRQYLEYKLQQIIRKVGVPVPLDFAIKDTNRMVGNCIDAINQALDLHEKAGMLVIDAQQRQDLLTTHLPAIVGNWVSHYETGSGSSLSAPVLSGVISAIDQLAECFRYDDNTSGTTVRRWYKSLSQVS